MEPLISVIVPVYNTEQYLVQCIESIIKQTYKNLEIILIDDGSADSSPQICDEYAKQDNRIKVIHKENRGVSSARNIGLKIVSGEYVGFVDSDDWIEPDMYNSMLSFSLENGLDICVCSAHVVGEDALLDETFYYYPDKTVLKGSELINKVIKDEIRGELWLKLFKKQCFDNVKFPENRVYEDLAVSHILFFKARKVGFLTSKFYNYRPNPSGITHSHSPKNSYDIFLGFYEHYNYALKNGYSDAELTCLKKAVTYGLGVFVRLKNDKEKKAFIAKFINENKIKILKSATMPRIIKLRVKIFLFSKTVYKVICKFLTKNDF